MDSARLSSDIRTKTRSSNLNSSEATFTIYTVSCKISHTYTNSSLLRMMQLKFFTL